MAVAILKLSLADGFYQSLLRIFAVGIYVVGNHLHKSIPAPPKLHKSWQRGLSTSLNSFLSWGKHQGRFGVPTPEGFLYNLNFMRLRFPGDLTG